MRGLYSTVQCVNRPEGAVISLWSLCHYVTIRHPPFRIRHPPVAVVVIRLFLPTDTPRRLALPTRIASPRLDRTFRLTPRRMRPPTPDSESSVLYLHDHIRPSRPPFHPLPYVGLNALPTFPRGRIVDAAVLCPKCPGPGCSRRIGCVQSGHAMLVRPPKSGATLNYHAAHVLRESTPAPAPTRAQVGGRHRNKLSRRHRHPPNLHVTEASPVNSQSGVPDLPALRVPVALMCSSQSCCLALVARKVSLLWDI